MNIKTVLKCAALITLMLVPVLGFTSAQAGQPRLISSHGDWEVYVFFEGKNKVCYIASQPQLQEGNYTKRGEPFALITHRPSENTRDVFSYIAGYTYKSGSEAYVTVDGQEFTLFTQDETAWGPDTQTDKKLAKAIQNGNKMVIKGTSTRGTLTTDTFSLKGSTKAYQVMSQECR